MSEEVDWEKIKDHLVIEPLEQDPFIKIPRETEASFIQQTTLRDYSKFLKSIKLTSMSIVVLLVLILILGIFTYIWNYHNVTTLYKEVNEFEGAFQRKAKNLNARMNSIIKIANDTSNNLDMLAANITWLISAYNNSLKKHDMSLIASSLRSNLYILITLNRDIVSSGKSFNLFNLTRIEIRPSTWKSILEKHGLTFCITMENFSSHENEFREICFHNQTYHLFRQPISYQGIMILTGQLNDSSTTLPVISHIIKPVPLIVNRIKGERKIELRNMGDESLIVTCNQTEMILRPEGHLEITLHPSVNHIVIYQLKHNLLMKYIISYKTPEKVEK